MPSDPPGRAALLAALGRAWATYRQAAGAAAEELEAYRSAAERAPDQSPAAELARALGPLGARALDSGRLAVHLVAGDGAPDPEAREVLAAARDALREVAAAADPPIHTLPAGQQLAPAVEAALARLGRGFGAAHVAALARAGRYQERTHAAWLEAYPFARWTRRERLLAPPLVLEADGADLHGEGLGEFVDGSQKIVLLARGDVASPAPLVRLITPRTYVVQSHDGSEADRFAAWGGPGVFAWLPPASARFVHDPEAGPTLGDRLRVTADAARPRRWLGRWSAAQLEEELAALHALTAVPAPASAPPPAGDGPSDPVDRLAAWILDQSEPGDGLEAGTS